MPRTSNLCGEQAAIPDALRSLALYESDPELCREWPELFAAWTAAHPRVDVLAEATRSPCSGSRQYLQAQERSGADSSAIGFQLPSRMNLPPLPYKAPPMDVKDISRTFRPEARDYRRDSAGQKNQR